MADDNEQKEMLDKIFHMMDAQKKVTEAPPPEKPKKKRQYSEEAKIKMREHLARAREKALAKRRENIQKKKAQPAVASTVTEPVQQSTVTHQPAENGKYYDELIGKIKVLEDWRTMMIQPKDHGSC